MDISHWDAAIHYGIQLAQYCDHCRFPQFHGWSSMCTPLPYGLMEHTQVLVCDSWVHRVPENGASAIGTRQFTMAWNSVTRYCDHNPIWLRTKIAPSVLPCPKTQEHQCTDVDHDSIGYPQMDISHWDRQFTMAFSLPNIVIKPYLVNAISRGSPPLPCPKTQEQKIGCGSQYWVPGKWISHSELPRPNGWCPFSGTLWTHSPHRLLWCSWVLGQGSTQWAISVK